MDGTVSAAPRSQTKLPGGSRQEPVLLLRLWLRRRCDSLCRTLSPGEVSASVDAAVPMAWPDAVITPSHRFLPHAVTPPREAVAYLHQRGVRSPEVIEHMRIGYAPGGCLRGWLTQLGYPLPTLRQAGLVTAVGYDAYMHRIVFPLEGNLYGRSLSDSAPPHRFLPGTKGGLYSWEQVRRYAEVILVEGLFDYAALWEAGFHNVTCSLGTHLNVRQFRQLCDGSRTVYLTLDADGNDSGQQAARCLSRSLGEQGITAHLVSLPEGHDPNSFFVSGGNADEFQLLLERACL